MTDVEISRLLSDLKDTAKKLNAESDCVAAILASVESELVAMNVGLETWLKGAPPLEVDTEREDVENARGGFVTQSIDHRTELGFARVAGEWCLAIRVEKCVQHPDYPGETPQWSQESGPSRLADASRHSNRSTAAHSRLA